MTIVDQLLELVATVLLNVILFSDVCLRGDDGDGGTPARHCFVEGLDPILNSSEAILGYDRVANDHVLEVRLTLDKILEVVIAAEVFDDEQGFLAVQRQGLLRFVYNRRWIWTRLVPLSPLRVQAVDQRGLAHF